MKTSLQLAEELLLALKRNIQYNSLETSLSPIEPSKLVEDLTTENKKKCFWINCYNAFYPIEIGKDNSKNVVKNKTICIANQKISLDEIEHGILRKREICGWFWIFKKSVF